MNGRRDRGLPASLWRPLPALAAHRVKPDDSDNGVVLLLSPVVKPNRQLHEEHLGVDLVHDEVWLEAMGGTSGTI